MTRAGDFTDDKGNVLVAAPINMTEDERIARENDLESLDFLYSSYGKSWR